MVAQHGPAANPARLAHPRAAKHAGRLAHRTAGQLPWQVFRNRPFRLAALIYLLCFSTGDIILVVLVRYLIDYVRDGRVFDAVVLATVSTASLVSIPLVLALICRTDKRTAYLISIGFMVTVLVVGAFLPPGAHNALLVGAVMAGVGFVA